MTRTPYQIEATTAATGPPCRCDQVGRSLCIASSHPFPAKTEQVQPQ